jgi:hypothetical protein
MLSPVKTRKTDDRERPITAAYAKNASRAVAGDIRLMPAESPNTKASGAKIMTHLRGLP